MAAHLILRAGLKEEAVIGASPHVNLAERDAARSDLDDRHWPTLAARHFQRLDAADGGRFAGGDRACKNYPVPTFHKSCGCGTQFILEAREASFEKMLHVWLGGKPGDLLRRLLRLPQQIRIRFIERGFRNDRPLPR